MDGRIEACRGGERGRERGREAGGHTRAGKRRNGDRMGEKGVMVMQKLPQEALWMP